MQVLRAHAMDPLPYRITVVVDRSVAVYSGMVPGVVAGQYMAHEVEIDVRPLARRCGVALVEAAATRVDGVQRQVRLEGRPPIAYDVASIDIGSTVAGLDTPGVRAHAVPTRPIGRFMEHLAARGHDGDGGVVVVGGGAGGVELAACLQVRLGRPTTLVSSGPLLHGGRVGARVEDALRRRGVVLRRGRATAVSEGGVELAGGDVVAGELVVWVAGAAALPLGAQSGLPVDARGWIRVGPTLQVEGHDDLFAVGDCAVLSTWPEIPKAGVYAVRQGPVLIDNLRRRAHGRALRPYRPQRDFFSILNFGDGKALGTKWGVAVESSWMFTHKDRIDRAFMDKFQVLDPEGRVNDAFGRGMPAMEPMDEACGGCAAKVAQGPLERALARVDAEVPVAVPDDVVLGLEAKDDAVAVRVGAELLVVNVDAFTAFTEDPWLVGRAAALNAISDVQVKGVRPRHAMALVTLPQDRDPEEALFQVLAGARRGLGDVALLGGHTTEGDALSVGFAVWGVGREEGLWRREGLSAGDRLVLTGPLGTGVLWRADMGGSASGPWMAGVVEGMLRGHAPALEALSALGLRPSAATDVTGFGFARHLLEILGASGVGAEVWSEALPVFAGALELLERGHRSTFHEANRSALVGLGVDADVDPHRRALLFDPQTCGPMLLGLPPAAAAAFVEAYPGAVEVGEVVEEQGAGTARIRRR